MKSSLKKWVSLFLSAALLMGTTGCQKEEKPAEGTEGMSAAVDPAKETTTVPALETAFSMAAQAPEVFAKSAILVEQSTGTVLFEKGAKEKMYPASMTKILTALTVLDYFSPDELLTVGTEINEVSLDSSKAGHVLGETLTVKNLIRGLIIPSGNDSANVLAAAVAKKVKDDPNLSFGQSETVFADLMNQKAKELGGVNSHFTNAHGYQDENHYSCAYDMALFAMAFMDNETLAEIAGERSFSGNGADNMFAEGETILTQDYNWVSHNLLITDNTYNYGYANGIKTGFTDEAGNCLTASATKDGETLIAVIFHSEDPGRWLDGKSLFEYGFNGYTRHELGKKDSPVIQIPLTKHNRLEGDTLDAVFLEDTMTFLPPGAEEKLSMTETCEEGLRVDKKDGTYVLKAPIKKGQKIGTLSYQMDGKTVLTKDIYAGRDVNKANLWSNIKYFFQNFGKIIFSVKGLIGLAVIIVVVAVIFLVMRFFSGRNRRMRGGAYTFRTPPSGKKKKRGGRGRF